MTPKNQEVVIPEGMSIKQVNRVLSREAERVERIRNRGKILCYATKELISNHQAEYEKIVKRLSPKEQ